MCALPVLGEPAPPSRCELFHCEAYDCELTFGGCLQRRVARRIVHAKGEDGRFTAELTTRPLHRFCARSCEQGRGIAERFAAGRPA